MVTASTQRYAIFGVHSILVWLTFGLGFLSSLNWTIFIMGCLSAIPWLIYVPASVILSIRRVNTKFDHAGGEVAYASVQLATITVGLILAIMRRVYTLCEVIILNPASGVDTIYDTSRSCRGAEAEIALFVIHAIVLGYWIWFVDHAVKSSSGSRKDMWQLSVHLIIGQRYAAVPIASTRGTAAASGMEDEWKAVNPFDDEAAVGGMGGMGGMGGFGAKNVGSRFGQNNGSDIALKQSPLLHNDEE